MGIKKLLPHWGHCSARLKDGRVLFVTQYPDKKGLANSAGFQRAELYDPIKNKFELTKKTRTAIASGQCALAALNNGNAVMVKNGKVAEVFNTKTTSFQRISDLHRDRNNGLKTTKLSGGKILVSNTGHYSNSVELFDPNTNTFDLITTNYKGFRFSGTAITPLPDNNIVFLVGCGRTSTEFQCLEKKRTSLRQMKSLLFGYLL